MKDSEKVRIIDLLLEEIKSSHVDDNIPIFVGTLNHPYGLRGFEMAEVGHPVFELKDRYIVYLESISPTQIVKFGEPTIYQKFNIAVPFYKETLSHSINFKK